MSIRILTAAALLATVALRPALAQGDKKPDFSGTWKVNTEKSDPTGGGGGAGARGGKRRGPEGSVAVTWKESHTLRGDGKTRPVVTTRTTPNGEQTTKRVY